METELRKHLCSVGLPKYSRTLCLESQKSYNVKEQRKRDNK